MFLNLDDVAFTKRPLNVPVTASNLKESEIQQLLKTVHDIYKSWLMGILIKPWKSLCSQEW